MSGMFDPAPFIPMVLDRINVDFNQDRPGYGTTNYVSLVLYPFDWKFNQTPPYISVEVRYFKESALAFKAMEKIFPDSRLAEIYVDGYKIASNK